MATLYIETSIVSYLRQRPSVLVVAAARQLLTRQWWDFERHKYDLVTSQYVLDEVAEGDPTLAAERLESLSGVPLLELTPEIARIATEIVSRTILPAQAKVDALHIAATAFHAVDYLLTWNLRTLPTPASFPESATC